jgi:hypothetical protein
MQSEQNGTQGDPGGDVGLDDPEGDPGAHHDQVEGQEDAEQEEPGLSLKVEFQEGDRVVPESRRDFPNRKGKLLKRVSYAR